MSFEITLATSEEEFLEAATLRYEVAVTEMGLQMTHADHRKRIVSEPLDDTGHVFIARHNTKIAATMRSNLLRECDVGFYYDAYGISKLPNHIDTSKVSISTRLAVAKQHRGENLAPLIQTAAYQYLKSVGVEYDVADCRTRLVPYFQRLGYKIHTGNYSHPEFGDVVVQLLNLWDEQHLQSVRSPFLELNPTTVGVLRRTIFNSIKKPF